MTFSASANPIVYQGAIPFLLTVKEILEYLPNALEEMAQ